MLHLLSSYRRFYTVEFMGIAEGRMVTLEAGVIVNWEGGDNLLWGEVHMLAAN
jgi:hypothetical protein